MKKWITIIAAIALCIVLLCLSNIAFVEEQGTVPTETTETEEDVDFRIIDFSFCTQSVTDDVYSLLKTDYPATELRLLRFKYYDWDGDERNGIIVINRHLEYEALDAFQDLYEAGIQLDDITLFAGDGFDICFWARLDEDFENDTCNEIFYRYDFAANDNQYGGCRHYTIYHKIPEWYP